jgi:hypothetical protein
VHARGFAGRVWAWSDTGRNSRSISSPHHSPRQGGGTLACMLQGTSPLGSGSRPACGHTAEAHTPMHCKHHAVSPHRGQGDTPQNRGLQQGRALPCYTTACQPHAGTEAKPTQHMHALCAVQDNTPRCITLMTNTRTPPDCILLIDQPHTPAAPHSRLQPNRGMHVGKPREAL